MEFEQGERELLFGDLLRHWRSKTKGLTLEQLAEELKKCGFNYDYTTLARYEREERTPTGEFFAHLSLCLGLKDEEALKWIIVISKQYAIRMALECKRVLKNRR